MPPKATGRHQRPLLQWGRKLVRWHRILVHLKGKVPSIRDRAPAILLHRKLNHLAHALHDQFLRHLHHLRLRAKVKWGHLSTAVMGRNQRNLRVGEEQRLGFAWYHRLAERTTSLESVQILKDDPDSFLHFTHNIGSLERDAKLTCLWDKWEKNRVWY